MYKQLDDSVMILVGEIADKKGKNVLFEYFLLLFYWFYLHFGGSIDSSWLK